MPSLPHLGHLIFVISPVFLTENTFLHDGQRTVKVVVFSSVYLGFSISSLGIIFPDDSSVF